VVLVGQHRQTGHRPPNRDSPRAVTHGTTSPNCSQTHMLSLCSPCRMCLRRRACWMRVLRGAALALLVVLPLLADGVRACGQHDGHAASWDREIEVKGRRRSLLSLKGRRYVCARALGGWSVCWFAGNAREW
jgi:hypothetical protein